MFYDPRETYKKLVMRVSFVFVHEKQIRRIIYYTYIVCKYYRKSIFPVTNYHDDSSNKYVVYDVHSNRIGVVRLNNNCRVAFYNTTFSKYTTAVAVVFKTFGVRECTTNCLKKIKTGREQ